MVAAGVLAAGSRDAFGRGDVQVRGGTLRVDAERGAVRVHGDYLQSAAGTRLELTLHHCHAPALTVARRVTLGHGAQLAIRLPDTRALGEDVVLPVISGCTLQGGFGSVTVDAQGYRATPLYTHDGLAVRLTRC